MDFEETIKFDGGLKGRITQFQKPKEAWNSLV